MKKNYTIIIGMAFIASLMLSGCQSKSEKKCFGSDQNIRPEHQFSHCAMLCINKKNHKACANATRIARKECLENKNKKVCANACLNGSVWGHAPGAGPFCQMEQKLNK